MGSPGFEKWFVSYYSLVPERYLVLGEDQDR